MKLLTVCFIALALVLSVSAGVGASPGIEVDDAVVVTAEILAVDKANRLLTLRGPKENVIEVYVGEEARNFDQLQVGDRISVTYYESLAVYLGQPGTQPEEDAAMVAARSEKGALPGGAVVGAIDVSAEVVGIDKKQRKLTLKLPKGNVVTTEVDKSLAAFDTLKVGDSIHARLTKAVAIAVERP